MAVGVDSPAPCCPKGSHVALAPQSACCGHEITLGVDGSGGGGGFRCYTSGVPTASRTAVLVFHDVFGMDSGNHKMVCDALAAQHYVIMPDFYDGWSIEPFYNAGNAGDGKKELARFNWAWCSPRVEAVLQHLSEIGIEKTGSIGFCWGAWGVAKACQDTRVLRAFSWMRSGGASPWNSARSRAAAKSAQPSASKAPAEEACGEHEQMTEATGPCSGMR
mmetsp:Transcript_22431/g.71746  ORF Transcript_22431/g.71746 Transcript_22431/m.71746 type:complete len:219 (-) Transcript_22431:256-912(-)